MWSDKNRRGGAEEEEEINWSDWWKVNSEVSVISRSQVLAQCEKAKLSFLGLRTSGENEVQDPKSPLSAKVICLNGETQHSNKSCMKCVFILNKTQQENTWHLTCPPCKRLHKYEGTRYCYCNNMSRNYYNCFSFPRNWNLVLFNGGVRITQKWFQLASSIMWNCGATPDPNIIISKMSASD